jgi:uncharacterized protein with PQ loop repeat
MVSTRRASNLPHCIARPRRPILETMDRAFLTNLVGWIPAIILPAATALQLVRIIRAPSSEGVSIATWALFGLANVSLYIFTEKYSSIQSILGLLLTALLNAAIVGLAMAKRPKR